MSLSAKPKKGRRGRRFSLRAKGKEKDKAIDLHKQAANRKRAHTGGASGTQGTNLPARPVIIEPVDTTPEPVTPAAPPVPKTVLKTITVTEESIPDDQINFDWDLLDGVDVNFAMEQFDMHASSFSDAVFMEEGEFSGADQVLRDCHDLFIAEMDGKENSWYVPVQVEVEKQVEVQVEDESSEEEPLPELEPLPAEIPPLENTEAYKAYMVLKYEHEQRENALILRQIKRDKKKKAREQNEQQPIHDIDILNI